jgi:hypothetical protein
VSSRAASPYQGLVDADPKGVSWGSAIRTHISTLQRRAGCQLPHSPSKSRPPVPTRVSRLTGAGSQPCATAGHRRKRWRSLPLHGPAGEVSVLTPVLGVLGAIRTHTAQRLVLVPPTELGYEDVEPPSGVEPDHPPYGGEAASRARRRRCRARIRTLTPVAQNDVACPISRPGIKCARRELNPHARRHRYLRPARLPVSPPALGAPPGTRTPNPKIKSLLLSPIELAARGAPPGN